MGNFVSKENADSLFGKVSERLGLRPKTFTGSHDEWDALTSSEQAEYQIVNFNDDYSECGSRIIEWSVWSAMTSEQQEAIPDATIINAPGIDGELKTDILKVLWTNPDPTSAFAAQNITLASDDYDFLLWIMKSYSSNNVQFNSIITKGSNGCVSIALADNTKIVLVRRRDITYVDDRTYYVKAGFTSNTTDNEFATDNNVCIPISVYGIKKTISLNFNAIISDVSTSADKCMMPNSSTSVEDMFKWGQSVNAGTFTKATGVSSGSIYFTNKNGFKRVDISNVNVKNAILAMGGNDSFDVGTLSASLSWWRAGGFSIYGLFIRDTETDELYPVRAYLYASSGLFQINQVPKSLRNYSGSGNLILEGSATF